jgi:hypothetical protein
MYPCRNSQNPTIDGTSAKNRSPISGRRGPHIESHLGIGAVRAPVSRPNRDHAALHWNRYGYRCAYFARSFQCYALSVAQKPRTRRAGVMTFDSSLRKLPLFDEDLYLGMQATNLHIVDNILRDMESQLLALYIEKERTPLPQAIVVSAFSQLWVFGLYEILRTWRTRGERILEFATSLEGVSGETRQRLIEEKKQKVQRAGEYAARLVDRWSAFERATRDARFRQRLQTAIDGSEILFRRIGALRMSLAKHEVPQSGGYALAPGYGRIHMLNGSIYWQVLLGDKEVDMISRRELADECERLRKNRSRFILPRAIQERVKMFPKRSYALRQVAVRLNDGTEYRRVLVYWSKVVVSVLGRNDIPFDARNVIAAEPDADPPEPIERAAVAG